MPTPRRESVLGEWRQEENPFWASGNIILLQKRGQAADDGINQTVILVSNGIRKAVILSDLQEAERGTTWNQVNVLYESE